MLVNVFLLIITLVCLVLNCALSVLILRQHSKEKEQWDAERARLLDRVQSGSLAEYKSQERADRPKVRPERDTEKERIRNLQWG